MKKDAKLYCPNPKNPQEGLRLKANGVYERLETIHGKRKSFSSRDPIEVWKKRAEYIATLEDEQEESALTQNLGPLFEEVADAYEEIVLEMKAGTVKAYRPAVIRAREYFKGKRMKEIAPWQIKEFLDGLNMAHTTTSNQKSVINAIFQLYIDSPKWRGDYNPAKLTTIPRGLPRSRRLPPDERQVQIVKDAALAPDMDSLMAILYLCTGERRGEACALTLGDIDFEKNVINVRRAVEWINNQPHFTVTKTEAGVRKIPLLNLLRQALQPFRNLPSSTFIIGLGKKPVTASWYRCHWAAFWRRYGYAHEVVRHYTTERKGRLYKYTQTDWVADVSAHQFRHEYVCMLAEAGVPEEIAIQMIGHANVKMIHEVYLHLNDRMLQEAALRVNMHLAELG